MFLLWIVVAWLYVVVMMTLAEAFSTQGTVLGAVFTLLGYGLLPLALVVYILGTPARRRAIAAREAAAAASAAAPQHDGRGHPPGGTGGPVTPEREER